ncbi:hypothetical protein [Singulisphaera sp. PoT]|uniref:hypothetical protein n=1 Tax=Singulisphaera sp. PoT TaxID=3411797 RepID=UPI003BF5576E
MSPFLRVLLGIVGVACVAGSLSLVWYSMTAMRIVIYWIGEERVLGARNVYVQPDGSKLLTNPAAMARVMMLIWALGGVLAVAGGILLRKSSRRRRS